MKLSYYTIVVDNYPSSGEYLLYHTRTQALVKIEQKFRDLLKDMSSADNFPLRMQYASELEQLYQMGIVVESPWEDIKSLVRFFGDLKYEKTSDSLPITIVTTTHCNFKCQYCFEEPSRKNINMTISTCDAVISWLKKRISEMGYRKLFLVFYGGEPLLNEEAMEYIALKMSSWCVHNQIDFKFTIQTNGYLMTSERVDKYRPMGLSDIRISLDGVGDEHDNKRPLRGGGGTFDTIMENIANNVDKVKIGLAVSYDKNGTGHVSRLLDYLGERGVLNKLGKLVVSPVHAALGPAGQAEKLQGTHCLINYSDAELVKAMREVDGALEKRGLPSQKGLPVFACPLVREHGGVTIDPQGLVYGCNSMIDHPEFAIGDIYNDVLNDKHKDFINMEVWQKCAPDCPYLPVCSGGCRLMSFLENGDFNTVSCKRAYLDQVAADLIKREYDALAGKPGRSEAPSLV